MPRLDAQAPSDDLRNLCDVRHKNVLLDTRERLIRQAKYAEREHSGSASPRWPCIRPTKPSARRRGASFTPVGNLSSPQGDLNSFRQGQASDQPGKDCVSVVVVALLSSKPTQSPAHNFVPLTVPTSLHPIGSFGFT